MSDLYKNANKLLKTALDFFDSLRLQVNTDKCISAAVRVLPGKKKLYNVSTSQFFVHGTPIPHLSTREVLQYLGQKYSHMGESKKHINDVKQSLQRVSSAPLKPYQKLAIVKNFLIPSLLSKMQYLSVTLKILKETDKLIRIFVRKILHLNRSCSNAFLHAPAREGGLEILQLRGMIPCILKSRLNGIRLFDAASAELMDTQYMIKTKERIDRWAESVGGRTKNLQKNWSDQLQTSYSGNGVNQGRCDPGSSRWVNTPPTFWSGEDYIKAVKLKGNLLPTKGIPSNPIQERGCGTGCNKIESLSHVLQGCPETHGPRVKRHDRIARMVKQFAEKRHWTVEEEPRLRLRTGALRKPDLILSNETSTVVCDISIVWEGPTSLNASHRQKANY